MIRNGMVFVGSILLVFILSLVADRAVGRMTPPPLPEGMVELIFPPRAEQSYASCDFEYTAHINSLGLREREIPRERGDAYRIVAIGDSYTYGWGVQQEETWLRRIETILQGKGYNVETINMGKPGAGPPFYASLAERAIPILRPDLVIVALLQGNDLGASGPEGLEGVKTDILDKVRFLYPNIVRSIRDHQRAKLSDLEVTQERPPQITTAEDNRRWTANTARDFLEKMPPEDRARFDGFEDKVKDAFLTGNLNPYMIDLAMQNPNFYELTDLNDPWIQDCVKNMGRHLQRIKHISELYGARVIVVSIPDGPYVNKEALKNIRRVGYSVADRFLDSNEPDRGIETACTQAGLPFYQVTKAFKDRKDDPGLYFELDGHLTATGHALYAESLAPVLEKVIAPEAPKK